MQLVHAGVRTQGSELAGRLFRRTGSTEQERSGSIAVGCGTPVVGTRTRRAAPLRRAAGYRSSRSPSGYPRQNALTRGSCGIQYTKSTTPSVTCLTPARCRKAASTGAAQGCTTARAVPSHNTPGSNRPGRNHRGRPDSGDVWWGVVRRKKERNARSETRHPSRLMRVLRPPRWVSLTP